MSAQEAVDDDRAAWTILTPGRNCWRREIAHRAAVMVDARDYFRALDESLRRAERSILIVGWDFDGGIRLHQGDGGGGGPTLGALLRRLVEERPRLEVRILVWSLAPIVGPSAPRPLLFGAAWQRHPRIRLRLDRCRPLLAAHHQKIVCVDDGVAFAGGIDLTAGRWDTARHAAADRRRRDSDGDSYEPVHDLQMAVDGDAAAALAHLARARWTAATGEPLAPAPGARAAWPPSLSPQFVGRPVAIARTDPGWHGGPPARESEALTIDAIRSAERFIYIEAQYLTAKCVADCLVEAVARPDGPEILVVATRSSHGLFERVFMGSNRDRLIRRVKRQDRSGRLGVFYPVVPGRRGDREVLIHAKLMIVDDRFLRVGSANLANRSMGLDTECDLAIEATDRETVRRIGEIRERLMGEHLAVDPETVAAAVREDRSILRAVDRLNRNPRGLRPFSASSDRRGPVSPFPGTTLADPDGPTALDRALHRWARRIGGPR